MLKVPLDLLATFDRALRPALPRVAAHITRQIDGASAPGLTPRSRVFALVKSFNLAALMETQFGRPEKARELCEAEIAWLGRVARGADAGLMAYAFQPWVNLARLDRFQGNYPDARRRLQVLEQARDMKRISLHGVRVERNAWPLLTELVPQLGAFLLFNWTYEGLLCALRSGDLSRINDIEGRSGGDAVLQGMAAEAHHIAARLSNGAHPAGEHPGGGEGSPLDDVLTIRRAELDPAALTSAAPALGEISGRMLDGDPTTWHLAMVQTIVALLWEADRDLALERAEAGYTASIGAGDEVFEAWFAGACAGGLNGGPWRQRVDDLAARSWYASVRRPDHPDDAARQATVGGVTSRLLEIALRERRAKRAKVTGERSGLPSLIQGVTPLAGNPRRATARMLFAQRQIRSLGPLLDAATPAAIREKIERADFAEQTNFAGKPYPEAVAASSAVAQYVLGRLIPACRTHFGADFDEAKVMVTVRVEHRNRYVQLQGPHIDWSKGTEFDEAEWGPAATAPAGRHTLRSLERLHSVDCVLGGPPTEFFLDAQEAIVHLAREDGEPWKVERLEFENLNAPQPGMTGEIVLRPAYTIHQFPSRASWTSSNEQRLFVSCDYRA